MPTSLFKDIYMTEIKQKIKEKKMTSCSHILKKLKEKHHLGTNDLLQHSAATEWRLIGLFLFIYNPFLPTQENKCTSNHIHTIKVKGFFCFGD